MDWTSVAVLAAVAGGAAILFSVAGLVGLYLAWRLDQRHLAARRERRALAAPRPVERPEVAPLRVAAPPPLVPFELVSPGAVPRMADAEQHARWAAEMDTIEEKRPEVRALWELEPDRAQTVQARRVDASRRGR